jgi:hypothetical protein
LAFTRRGPSAATNDELVAHIRTSGVAMRDRQPLTPFASAPRSPSHRESDSAVTWFSVRGHVDGGIQARITAEAKDDESANQLRDVVRGFLALAKLQTSSKPEFSVSCSPAAWRHRQDRVAQVEVPAGFRPAGRRPLQQKQR